MLKILRNTAILEGISYLLLLFNMIVFKSYNLALYKKLLFPIGMSHGVLFVAYILFTLLLIQPQKWNFKTTMIILGASLLPFATFYVEKKYFRF